MASCDHNNLPSPKLNRPKDEIFNLDTSQVIAGESLARRCPELRLDEKGFKLIRQPAKEAADVAAIMAHSENSSGSAHLEQQAEQQATVQVTSFWPIRE